MSSLGFEGFDHESNYHLTEQEEKNENWSQAKIWVVLGVIMALCLGITLFLHTKELILKYNGNSIVTECKEGARSVTVKDISGNTLYIPISDTINSPKNGHITIYYWGDNVAKAKPLTALWFWAMMYSIWVPSFSICVYCIIRNINQGKNIHKTN